MPTTTRRRRASELIRFDQAIRSERDQMRADSAAKRAAAPRSDSQTNRSRRLTLDDFGGRSDALGRLTGVGLRFQTPSRWPVESPWRGTPSKPSRSSMVRNRLLIGCDATATKEASSVRIGGSNRATRPSSGRRSWFQIKTSNGPVSVAPSGGPKASPHCSASTPN